MHPLQVVVEGTLVDEVGFCVASRLCTSAVMEKKTESVQYALRWRLMGNRWQLVGNRWQLEGNRWG